MGHATLLHGQVLRKRCKIAYCGQRPWLRNTSIRKNIIGPNPFDPVLYEVVLNSCALNQDLQQLPNRDLTIVGINGAKLSGGQKHKVVRHPHFDSAFDADTALRRSQEASTRGHLFFLWTIFLANLTPLRPRIFIRAFLAPKEYCEDLRPLLYSLRTLVSEHCVWTDLLCPC